MLIIQATSSQSLWKTFIPHQHSRLNHKELKIQIANKDKDANSKIVIM